MIKMRHPAGLAVNKHGNILVADEWSNRLLVLDSSLNSAYELSVGGGLEDPYSLWYELLGGRVTVVDHLSLHYISSVMSQRC